VKWPLARTRFYRPALLRGVRGSLRGTSKLINQARVGRGGVGGENAGTANHSSNRGNFERNRRDAAKAARTAEIVSGHELHDTSDVASVRPESVDYLLETIRSKVGE
jgi:hypothetical protein